MSKDESLMLKGVAILLMVFLHLFNMSSNVSLCVNFIYIGDTPLVHVLSRAANPVAFYLILGGYGMYKVYEKGVDNNKWQRIGKLYLNYWVILTLFLLIGYILRPGVYPGSVVNIIYNYTGYWTTFNGEMWFLLPYVILTLLSPFIFSCCSKFRIRYIVAFFLFIHLCTSFCISRFGEIFLYRNLWAYTPLLVLHLSFNFVLGAMSARSGIFDKIKNVQVNVQNTKYLAMGGVIVLVSIACVFKYNFFYAFGVISCLLLIPRNRWINMTLCQLGKHSMNMWMIHSWLCYYIFHGFIYSFRYPVIIFVITVVLSLGVSFIINFIAKSILVISKPKKIIASLKV